MYPGELRAELRLPLPRTCPLCRARSFKQGFYGRTKEISHPPISMKEFQSLLLPKNSNVVGKTVYPVLTDAEDLDEQHRKSLVLKTMPSTVRLVP